VKFVSRANKQLLRMMEDPDKRRAVDKAELSLFSRTRAKRTVCAQGRIVFP